MIEITGWISIHVTTDGENGSKIIHSVINQINQIVQTLDCFNQFLRIEVLNGVHTLFIGVNHNHDNGYSESIYMLSSEINKIAPGSYGIVYIRNHEHGIDYNKFKVLKIAKGNTTIEDDKFISPCNPIIED